jgi:hypothetical protein
MIPTRGRNTSRYFTVTVLYNITRYNNSALVGQSGACFHKRLSGIQSYTTVSNKSRKGHTPQSAAHCSLTKARRQTPINKKHLKTITIFLFSKQ